MVKSSFYQKHCRWNQNYEMAKFKSQFAYKKPLNWKLWAAVLKLKAYFYSSCVKVYRFEILSASENFFKLNKS